MSQIFRFKSFTIEQDQCAMKVGTDGVLLGAWTTCHEHHQILDIGTGTGVIALMMAQRNPIAEVHAIEIDSQAANQAKSNIEASQWSNRIKVLHKSIQEYWKEENHSFDHIVTNPPFFTGGTLSLSQDKTSVRHTTKLSHGDLLTAVRSLLSEDGTFSLILPNIEGYRCIELAKTYNLHPIRITEVYPDSKKPLERLLITFGRKESPHYPDQLYIRDTETGDFSDQYKELTKDFYLKF